MAKITFHGVILPIGTEFTGAIEPIMPIKSIKPPAQFIMPFGKHYGMKLSAIDFNYLSWLHNQINKEAELEGLSAEKLKLYNHLSEELYYRINAKNLKPRDVPTSNFSHHKVSWEPAIDDDDVPF